MKMGVTKRALYGCTLYAEGSSKHLCELQKNEPVLLLASGTDFHDVRFFKVLTKSGLVGEVVFDSVGD